MNDPIHGKSADERRGTGHEATDVSPSLVSLSAVGLLLVGLLILVLLSSIFWRFLAVASRRDAPQSAVASEEPAREPRLQSDPAADLARWRLDQEQLLSNYGWIDRDEGLVRIPIDRAMEMLAERGFPEPAGPVAQPPEKESQP